MEINKEGSVQSNGNIYEVMRPARREKCNSRGQKSLSLNMEEFPLMPEMPAMPNIFPEYVFNRPKCSICVGGSPHFILRCRECRRCYCCKCSYKENICPSCKILLHSPLNAIERFDMFGTGQQGHSCVLQDRPESNLKNFVPQGDSIKNLKFIYPIVISLSLLASKDLSDVPGVAYLCLVKILSIFTTGNKELQEYNISIVFKKFEMNEILIKNIGLCERLEGDVPVYSGMRSVVDFLGVVQMVKDNKNVQSQQKWSPLCSKPVYQRFTRFLAFLRGSLMVLCILTILFMKFYG